MHNLLDDCVDAIVNIVNADSTAEVPSWLADVALMQFE